MITLKWILSVALLGALGCGHDGGTTGGNPLTEDDSASGAAAQAVGGALSNSSSGGLHAFYKSFQPATAVASASGLDIFPTAWAAELCPTFKSMGPQCNTSGAAMTLTYSDCQFPSSGVSWHGREQLTMSAGVASCGVFPNPGSNGSLYRQFVNVAGNAPSAMLLTSSFGTIAAIDHATANLSNYDSVTIPTLLNGGYGMRVDFNSGGGRSKVVLDERVVVSGSYDHSLVGQIDITEVAGSGTRTCSGPITVYLNHLKIIGTSTFMNVTHTDQCCQPTSGQVKTTFAQGNSTPTTEGALLVGFSETLTFTGCGTAQLQAYDGSVKQVKLSRCF